MDNGHERERVGRGVGGAGSGSGVVCGWVGISASVGEADSGDASEGEVRLVRLGAGTEKAGYVGVRIDEGSMDDQSLIQLRTVPGPAVLRNARTLVIDLHGGHLRGYL
jgi:hypothetical protein